MPVSARRSTASHLLPGEDSIREVIPFPMNKNAQDLMMDAQPPSIGNADNTIAITSRTK